MARKTKEDALETRSQILDSAEKVFFEQGVARSSLLDVAKSAGLSRGAIYWHFKNKSDLLEAMVDRIRLPLESLADACSDPHDPDPLGKLHNFWIQTLKEVARNPRRRRVLSIIFHKCELNNDTRQLGIRRQAAALEYRQQMEICLQQAVMQGQLPKDLDTHRAAIAKQAFFIGLINNWLFLPGSFDLENTAEAMVKSYFCMLQHSPNMRSASNQ